MEFKKVVFRGKFLIGLAIGIVLTGGVAYSASHLNTPETGYLLCVDKKTKNVRFPATQKCPPGASSLIVGAQGIQGLKGDSGIQGETGPMGPQGMQGPQASMRAVTLNYVVRLPITLIDDADGLRNIELAPGANCLPGVVGNRVEAVIEVKTPTTGFTLFNCTATVYAP
jgi:hypothetical protein